VTVSATTFSPSSETWRRRLSLVQDATLVVVAAFFMYAHAAAVIRDGQWTSAVFAIEQLTLVCLFLFRRKSRATSVRLWDWVVASVGGWLPLVLRPAGGSGPELVAVGIAMQVLGGCGTIIAFSYLGRSFGVVAANRGLKVHGPYRLVRHPIYATHMVTTTGFLLANPSALNIMLVSVITAAQLARIESEERLLTSTADYGAYRDRVRWRLLPGVY
jgi:hypothetical protein